MASHVASYPSRDTMRLYGEETREGWVSSQVARVILILRREEGSRGGVMDVWLVGGGISERVAMRSFLIR